MEKYNFKDLGVKELAFVDLKIVNGGGRSPISRFVEWFLCDYCKATGVEMVHNTMVRRGI